MSSKTPRTASLSRPRRTLPQHPVLWNYITSTYKDNYVDPKQFLERLTIGCPNVKSYRATVLGALHVANHVCLVGALVGTWVSFASMGDGSDGGGSSDDGSGSNDVVGGMLNIKTNTLRLFAFELASFLFTMLLFHRATLSGVSRKTNSLMLVTHLKQAAVLITTVVLLSPVYATLTTSISSDTTIALITVLMIAHLYLYDYNETRCVEIAESDSGKRVTPSSPISLMCGMCASILASTTMHGIVDVIGVTLLALQLYIGSPYFLYGMYSACGKVWTSVIVSGIVLAGLPLLSRIWLGALLVVIVVLCPMWMVRIDKFKSHIRGPWDEIGLSMG